MASPQKGKTILNSFKDIMTEQPLTLFYAIFHFQGLSVNNSICGCFERKPVFIFYMFAFYMVVLKNILLECVYLLFII